MSYLFEDEDITNEWYIGEDRNQTKNTKEDIELLYRFREHVDDWVEKNNSTSKYAFLEKPKIPICEYN